MSEHTAESDALTVIRAYLEQALSFLGITVPEQVSEAMNTLSATRVIPPAVSEGGRDDG